jgi:hypothetical protein
MTKPKPHGNASRTRRGSRRPTRVHAHALETALFRGMTPPHVALRGKPCLELPWLRQERHAPAGLLAHGSNASCPPSQGSPQWLRPRWTAWTCARRLQLQGQPQIWVDGPGLRSRYRRVMRNYKHQLLRAAIVRSL